MDRPSGFHIPAGNGASNATISHLSRNQFPSYQQNSHLNYSQVHQSGCNLQPVVTLESALASGARAAQTTTATGALLQQQQQVHCLSMAPLNCPQQQQQQQQQTQQYRPIFSQIFQPLQTYHPVALMQQTPAFQPPLCQAFGGAGSNNSRSNLVATISSRLQPHPQSQSQQLYGHIHAHPVAGAIERQSDQSSTQLQQELQLQNSAATMLANISLSSNDKMSSISQATQFSHTHLSPSLTPAKQQQSIWQQHQQQQQQHANKAASGPNSNADSNNNNNHKPIANQKSKLVNSDPSPAASSTQSRSSASASTSASSSSSSSTNNETGCAASASAALAAADGRGRKLKSYLAQHVLGSNIPFAYAIILVAFLITIIAATSIITVLTIVLTITGYTTSPLTENTFNISLAIGVLCASVALILVTASLIVWRRHCQAAYYYLDDPPSASRGTNSPQLSETFDDTEYGSIPVADWAKHVQRLHADSDHGFSREFAQIQRASNQNLTHAHSKLAENKHKNRYVNIVAYDHTRVMLRTLPGQKKPGSDYINANFIDGYNKPRAYIGTQGPLVSTFDDYWRMIWEQRVAIIVMITNLQERGRRKCDMYWPKEGTETYGHIEVKLLQEVVMATYTLRTFSAKNNKMKKKKSGCHERKVFQYHYTNWPDHGVPDHPLPVLSFIRKSASANPPGAGAIICHCSAGCGRSGTYIVIDAMLKQIRHRDSINVVDFLKHIRNQRNYLVQTEEQYIFIHDALVEALESGETEISSSYIARYIQLLQTGGGMSQKNSSNSIAVNGALQQALHQYGQQQQQTLTVNAVDDNNNNIHSLIDNNNNKQGNLIVGDVNTMLGTRASGPNGNNIININSNSTTSRSQSAGPWSLLERQYRLVASFKAKDFNVVSALKPYNKKKNRTLNLIPLEAHRVHITPRPGIEGSDYINATFLMGFNHLREFILTQHPVKDTFSDFWQMVYDHNSQTIVLLTQMNDLEEFPKFWPEIEEEIDYGSFKVKLTKETTIAKSENGGLIVTRDFIMRSNQDDYELQTRIVHCPGWPASCGPLSAVFDLIQVVQKSTLEQAAQYKLHDGLASTTTVTIGQEHEPQNGGPVVVIDQNGGTEAATFAVLTTLFKQINFEDSADVYLYAKMAHLRRPGIWTSQDDYLLLYRAIENYASRIKANKAASAASSTLMTNFHQRTMTLDRHRSASSIQNTSTMRRQPNTISQLEQRQAMLPQSKSQILVDTNGNNNGSSIGNVAGNQAATFMRQQQQQQQQQQHPAQHNQAVLNQIIMQRALAGQAVQQQQQLKPLQSNNSPYNSAASIGAGSHQHLLASNGRGPQMGNL